MQDGIPPPDLPALRNILGHKDINMTLWYASVTQEKVRDEYFAALKRMKEGFVVEPLPEEGTIAENDYQRSLFELSLTLKKQVAPTKGLSANKMLHLKKRIERLKQGLKTVLN